jgi:hypothetical protein
MQLRAARQRLREAEQRLSTAQGNLEAHQRAIQSNRRANGGNVRGAGNIQEEPSSSSSSSDDDDDDEDDDDAGVADASRRVTRGSAPVVYRHAAKSKPLDKIPSSWKATGRGRTGRGRDDGSDRCDQWGRGSVMQCMSTVDLGPTAVVLG